MLSGKWQPFRLGIDMLKKGDEINQTMTMCIYWNSMVCMLRFMLLLRTQLITYPRESDLINALKIFDTILVTSMSKSQS